MIGYRLFALIGVFFLSYGSPVEKSWDYIEQYKELAIIEMARSGVPASIKLAQGLLESRYGTSELALEANNHFGIKCKRYWQGQTYYYQDDDYDRHGRLTHSCFRAYASSIDSYVDHTNFLKHTDHYAELFHLSPTDYVSWAHGLKRCGYATDPNYAQKLIRKIEDFRLYEYDRRPATAVTSQR